MEKNEISLWFGRRYPKPEDLESALESRGCQITQAETGGEALFVVGENGEPHVVIIPSGVGPLRLAWLLAHELGHLVLHKGYISDWTYRKQEAQASRWAAQALIPEAAILRHQNASVDAFIAALSAHYEDIPAEDCPQRRLAAEIANRRLRALEEVA